MRRSLHAILWASCLFISVSCTKETVDDTVIPVALNAVEVEQQLFEIVNEHRVSMGSEPLQFSALAYDYANLHNDYMISKGTISHDNFSSRASKIAAETNAKEIAENVAMDYPDAVEAFQGWLDSPNHKGTMEADYTNTAISVKKGSDGTLFYTQIFFK
ncbi:CAP domain-containing protein [Muriicola soli]|uniref:CAP domain-containing protein n=1 Tax=Muriicola soli TaxID=2507538 RepID=A0A411ECK4_9FLAO|nr:CAP domain-containing protein [Muriicola soli]QBA65233.1 CAP domain-containing protein [Muriicola soli]